MTSTSKPVPAGKKLICRAWVRHPVTGQKIFPLKGKAFCFLVDE